MPSNITGRGNTIIVNTFENGIATQVTSNNSSQSNVNVKISQGTTAKTTLANSDKVLLEESDGSMKHILGSHLTSVISNLTFVSPNLYPNATTTNFLIGTTVNEANSHKFIVDGTAKITGVLTLGSTINSLTLPSGTDTLVSRTSTDFMQNKQLKLPLKILDSSNDHNYVFAVSELTDNRTVTLPLLLNNDEFVFKNHTQTLTNKTFGDLTIFNNGLAVKQSATNTSGNVRFF